MTKKGDAVVWVRDGVPLVGQIVARPDEDHYRLLFPSGTTAQPFIWNCFPVGTRLADGTLLLDIDDAAIVLKQTDYLLTKGPIKEKIRALRQAKPSHIQRHGVTTVAPVSVAPRLGRGRLNAYDVPDRLSDRLVPYDFSYQFLRYLEFSTKWSSWRVRLLTDVLEKLAEDRPRQAQIYRSCVVGGIPWQNPETGFIETGPQPIEYLALDLLQWPGTIKNNVTWASAYVTKYVGADPRSYFQSLA